MKKGQYFDILWDNMFAMAEEFFAENNHLLIPHSYAVNGLRLGAWISVQRTSYHSKKISPDRKRKLDQIGMVWDVKEFQWFRMYGVAKQYYEQYGDLMVPVRYISPTGEKLGGWIAQQRKNYSRMGSEKESPLFTAEKRNLLEQIDMVWDASDAVQSTSFPEQCLVYYATKAGLSFKHRTLISGVEIDILFPEINIGIEYDGERWHKNPDKDVAKNCVCRDAGLQLIRIREPKCPILSGSTNYILKGHSYSDLSNVLHLVFLKHFGIDMPIDVDKDQREIIEQYIIYSKQRWKNMITLLSSFKNEHGHLHIARDAVIDGYLVGSWIHDIRKRNKNNQLYISNAQRKQLDDLGFVWDEYEDHWNKMYHTAKNFFEANGNLQVLSSFVAEPGNDLLTWLNEQRKKYNKGTLSQERINRLNELNFVWNPIQSRWDYMYQLAAQYYMEHGDLLVPAMYITADERLGSWITVQRKKYLHPSAKTGNLSCEQILKLEKLEMVWDVDEWQWQEMLALCKAYLHEHGNLRINRNYVVGEKKLGVWIGQQRVRFNRHDGSISQEHVDQLDTLGMVWDELQMKWLDYYDLAKKYYSEFGTINIPQKTHYDGKALGKWVYNQKDKAKRNLLSCDQVRLLQELQLTFS